VTCDNNKISGILDDKTNSLIKIHIFFVELAKISLVLTGLTVNYMIAILISMTDEYAVNLINKYYIGI